MGRATSAEEVREDKVDKEQISSFFSIYLLMIHKFHNLMIAIISALFIKQFHVPIIRL